ncbi:histidine kinase dimerization/phospho-acceptor domain-containing protein [Nocardioides plantarum]|uniref:histidine kinase n=1 Tax=Nocardioides plantarum TaxID=29299 RepID=A0ABV5KCU0_9ACTN|nr:histidine kinase dimerization/phospho-acceptor domain-containing protein [Nocardioides plantarum]
MTRPVRQQRGAGVVGLLLLFAVLGWLTSRGGGPEHLAGLWPIGLGTGAVVLSVPRWRPVVALAVGLVAAAATSWSGLPGTLVLGAVVTTMVEVLLAARLLQRADGRRPELRTDDELRRYLAACVLAGVVAAPLVAVFAVADGLEHPGRAALSVGLAHTASHLCFVPFFLRLPTQAAIARRGERIAQWVAIVVATPFLLVPEASPAIVFLVIPLLAWGALRVTALESLVQLLGVVVLAVVLTSNDAGPFADIPLRYDLPAGLRGVFLSAFCASCAVIVVPCVLRVGEYRDAARRTANERDLVRGIVDGASGVAIVGTDPQGRVTLFNPGAERLLGYRAEEVLGRGTRMLHSHQAISDKAAELQVEDDFGAVTEAMVHRRLVNTLVRFRRKDGIERTHAMTLTRLAPEGETTGFVATSEDVTDRLDTEQALRDALETERRAVERLQDVDAVKDQFVSTVSHELRTPLTSILGYLEMLADGTLGTLDSAQVDALLRVQSNSQRLLSLIDDLLTLSHVTEGGLRDEDEFDLRDPVRTAYQVVAPSWERSRRLDVTLALPEGPSRRTATRRWWSGWSSTCSATP